MGVAQRSPTVFVVDDDPEIRFGLDSLLRSVDLRVRTYASGAELLQHPFNDEPACLILDVRLKGESGLDLQIRLAEMGVSMPIIFLSGHGDIAMSVKAMKAGALDFLVKPYREQDLLDAVMRGLETDSKRRETGKASAELRSRYDSLTQREREVVAHAARGLMNKQIAYEMGLSEITIKIHRGHAMKKMRAKTFADLVKMSQLINGS
jgi:FixJ family two-component response regulator